MDYSEKGRDVANTLGAEGKVNFFKVDCFNEQQVKETIAFEQVDIVLAMLVFLMTNLFI